MGSSDSEPSSAGTKMPSVNKIDIFPNINGYGFTPIPYPFVPTGMANLNKRSAVAEPFLNSITLSLSSLEKSTALPPLTGLVDAI